MEITITTITHDDYYINRTIMISEKDGLNSFYKVIKHTDKMFYIKKIKTETKLIKTYYDDNNNEESKVYEAKLSDEFENDNIKKIKKTSINKYSVIFCLIVQYKV